MEVAGRYLFWGGVMAWPGLFSLLAVSFAARAFAPDLRRYLLRRTRQKTDPACAPTSRLKRRALSFGLFSLYFLGCCVWTRTHPVHDAIYYGSYKLKWGAAPR